MRRNAVHWSVILSLIGGGWFAAERGLAARQVSVERDRAVARLSEAESALARYPDLFRGNSVAAGDVALKNILQDASTKHGLQLGFLTEAEKESGKGRREKQVSARLVRAPHAKLVTFLADLEAKGSGAVVREVHLRPSKGLSDVYEEAEVVYSRTSSVPGAKP